MGGGTDRPRGRRGPFAAVGAAVSRRREEHPDAPVVTVLADAESLRAFGANVLDPATLPVAAAAGREQGRRIAAEVVVVWDRPPSRIL